MGHSPEVLRAFYLIALTKDRNQSESPPEADRNAICDRNVGTGSQEGLPLFPLQQLSSPNPSTGLTTEIESKSQDNLTLEELSDDDVHAGTLQTRSIVRTSIRTRKPYPCQQCRLRGFPCDLQRPSCWKCQQYFLPCFYEHEGPGPREANELADPEAEPICWEDSVLANPYQNLEREGKLRRVYKRSGTSRRGRLSKPMPRNKDIHFDEADLKDERENLLSTYSPTVSDVDSGSRTVSPIPWLSSESVHQSSRPNSSECTISLALTESRPSLSSPGRSFSVCTSPPTSSGSSLWPAQRLQITLVDAPRLFHCTFCLKQCQDRKEWELHELSQHIPDKIWICMPNGPIEDPNCAICVFCGTADPDPDHSSQHIIEHCHGDKAKDQTFLSKGALQQHLSTVHNQKEMTYRMNKWCKTRRDDDWYWNCGFCDTLLPRWSDRMIHIGDHFSEGMAMSSWDPLIPAYPLNRVSLQCATWFPPVVWDQKALWDLERKRCSFPQTQEDDPGENEYRCEHCDDDVYFGNEAEVQRHSAIWHDRREMWWCPTMRSIKASSMAEVFFPAGEEVYPFDQECPYCQIPFSELAESDPGIEIEDHLEVYHGVNTCQPIFKSISKAEMLLHLANIHNITLENALTTAEVLESCRREQPQMAKKFTKGTVKCDARIQSHPFNTTMSQAPEVNLVQDLNLLVESLQEAKGRKSDELS